MARLYKLQFLRDSSDCLSLHFYMHLSDSSYALHEALSYGNTNIILKASNAIYTTYSKVEWFHRYELVLSRFNSSAVLLSSALSLKDMMQSFSTGRDNWLESVIYHLQVMGMMANILDTEYYFICRKTKKLPINNCQRDPFCQIIFSWMQFLQRSEKSIHFLFFKSKKKLFLYPLDFCGNLWEWRNIYEFKVLQSILDSILFVRYSLTLRFLKTILCSTFSIEIFTKATQLYTWHV